MPSGSMAVALAALMVALSGTAIAASRLVSGDRLIKKHSLSGNRLRNHSVTGKQVNLHKLGTVPKAKHAERATRATKAETATFAAGAGTKLASGQTLTGMWSASGYLTAGGQAVYSTVSFAERLSTAPTLEYVSAGQSNPPNCPGTVSDPTAAPGYLCVYEFYTSNAAGVNICSLSACPRASPFGFGVDITSSAAGLTIARGSYAVTAP